MTSIDKIKNYWNSQPCNVNHSKKQFLSIEYFNEVENKKYFVEPHIKKFAMFENWKNQEVLEIGCGIGTDAINFVRNGAIYTGLELSDKSLDITKKRFDVFNLEASLFNKSAEDDLSFLGYKKYDLIYSFGVLHHTPNIDKCLQNIHNLLKDDGILKIMVYSTNSWKKIMINSNLDQYEAQSNCPLANTYTNEEITNILKDNKFSIKEIKQEHIFPYKIPEYKNNSYIKQEWFDKMPSEMFEVLENKLGWHLCITAIKT